MKSQRLTVLQILMLGICLFSNLVFGASSTIFTTQTPAAVYSDGPYELGMKWTSSRDGEVTKVRFYRAQKEPEDGGEFYRHMGHVWDGQGNLLATVPFAGATGATGEGWETAALFEPLPIEAGKKYVVSVNILSDYVATPGGLVASFTNGPLSTIADGQNGVYSLSPGRFPTRSHLNTNYFVDVEVVHRDHDVTTATVLTTEKPETSYWGGPYELGMKWTSSEAGTITKMRFYRAQNEPEDGAEFYEHLGHIWDERGNLLATVPFAGATGTSGEGWETVALAAPVPIEAGKTYVVSVNIMSDYVMTPAGLAFPITNGPLASVADGNNGVYSLIPGEFPGSSLNNSNYFVDVEVEFSFSPLVATRAVGTRALLAAETPEERYSDGPYELGLKWTSTQAGKITKIRFFRALEEAEDGPESYVHSGRIWDENGNLLATVPFAGASGRTGEGWETVSLVKPLPIEANKIYVASVNVISDYVGTMEGLAYPITNGPLSSIADGNNGVYSAIPATFPTESWSNSNYFVDVEISY